VVLQATGLYNFAKDCLLICGPQIANNTDKALKLQQQADDIEDALSKENSDISATVTLLALVGSLSQTASAMMSTWILLVLAESTAGSITGGCECDYHRNVPTQSRHNLVGQSCWYDGCICH
jgi:hypothetical protein